MPRTVTLKDIGEAVGVSHATVSRVLNNVPGRCASDRTRRRILQVAQKMAYHPSVAGQALRKNRTNVIGLVIGPIANSMERVSEIDGLARKAGHRTMISYTLGNVETEFEVLRNMVGWRVAGLLLIKPAGEASAEAVSQVMARGIPLVSIGEVPGVSTCTVDADRLAAAEMATTHLIEIGRKRIALFFSGWEGSSRLAGLRNAMKRAGRDPGEAVLVPIKATSMQETYQRTRELLKEGVDFDAVFACDLPTGVSVMTAIVDAGLRIPQDIAIVSQGERATANFTAVSMTTVSLAEKDVLRASFDMLMSEIKGPEHQANRKLLFHPRLIVRQSTVPADDPGVHRCRPDGPDQPELE